MGLKYISNKCLSLFEIAYFALAAILAFYDIYVDLETLGNSNPGAVIPPNAFDHALPGIVMFFLPASVGLLIWYWRRRQFFSAMSPLLMFVALTVYIGVGLTGASLPRMASLEIVPAILWFAASAALLCWRTVCTLRPSRDDNSNQNVIV